MSIVEDIETGRLVRPLRRIRHQTTNYERLQRPENIQPGEPIPSIEGWVLLLRHIPDVTQTVHIKNFFTGFHEDTEYFGTITDVKLPIDDFGNCTGWALVELDTKLGFDRAIAELNGSTKLHESVGVESASGILVSPTFVGEEEELAADGAKEEAAASESKRLRTEDELEASDENAAKKRKMDNEESGRAA